MQWSKWFIFWNIFLYCKIIISFLELFSATCFLCILKTHLTKRNTSVPKKVKKRQHMTFMMSSNNDKVTFVNFFINTYSILSIHYMYKISCIVDKKSSEIQHVFSPRTYQAPPPALRFSEKLISDRVKEEFILKVVNLNKFWNF